MQLGNLMKEKILLIDGNKTLAELLSKKIKINTEFETVVASSKAEVYDNLELGEDGDVFAEEPDFFLALIDLNVKDFEVLELVDYVLSKNIPVIIFTASQEKSLHAEIMKKDIMFFASKGTMDDINFILMFIGNISDNRGRKILIVEDSMPVRSAMKKTLSRMMFNVLVAAHGEEAMSVLKDNPDIKIIITDFNMPVKNGYELTKEVRKKYSRMELYIIGMTGADAPDMSLKFFKVGANDFIKKPFSDDELICRVNNSAEMIDMFIQTRRQAQSDFLTGFLNKRSFYYEASEYVSKMESNEEFIYSLINIINLKELDDKHGHNIADSVVRTLSHIIKTHNKENIVLARIKDDEFGVLIKNPNEENALKEITELKIELENTDIKTQNSQTMVKAKIAIGAKLGKKEDTLDKIIKGAEIELYKAKESKENKISYS